MSATETDQETLRAVEHWIETFVARPNDELGRPGPVCPFVPGALERNTLRLVAETIGDRTPAEIVELVREYQRQFLATAPVEGDDAIYKAFVVVFTDLPADRAAAFFAGLLDELAVPSYTRDGLVMGGFYEGNEGTAIYNAHFRPFASPVPFLLIRQAVVGDWKFFLDDDDAIGRWAHRYGEAGAEALSAELRGLPWRQASLDA
jgi:hypothetical protein